MRLVFLFCVGFSTLLFADPWKGEEYAKHSASQKASADDFLQKSRFEGVASILDVGCGDGKITAAMARLLPEAAIVGVDISPSMIQAALTMPLQTNLRFEVQDAAGLKFQNQFDLITSFTVMQWVLDQAGALRCFAQALKPGGKVWIQMPTGLPAPMQQALTATLNQERWKESFAAFNPPWRFYQPEEYRILLNNAGFTVTRLALVPKRERFPSRAAFQGFLRQWFPYLRPLPESLKDTFLTELVDRYLQISPPDAEGGVAFHVERLEAEATK